MSESTTRPKQIAGGIFTAAALNTMRFDLRAVDAHLGEAEAILLRKAGGAGFPVEETAAWHELQALKALRDGVAAIALATPGLTLLLPEGQPLW